MNVNSLPEMMKSTIRDEETSVSSRGTFRGGRGEGASKEWSRYLGDPMRQDAPTGLREGINNLEQCRIWESERFTMLGR